MGPFHSAVCLQVADSLKRGYQAMVFVHSRKDTGKTARTLADLAGEHRRCRRRRWACTLLPGSSDCSA